MIVNFEIEENYALNYNERRLDLHNNFDFISYEYIVAKRQLKLVWTKAPGSWVPEDEVPELELIHSNVSYFDVNYNQTSEFTDDDKHLGEISYYPSSERNVNNVFTPQTEPQEGDDILYTFESGYFIRVGCGQLDLIIA